MPESPRPKYRAAATRSHALECPPAGSSQGYVELEVTSNYTFLTGASHPEELAQRAAALGMRAMGITDTNTLAGIVRAHGAAKEVGIRALIGCRLRFIEPAGLEVLVYPTSRAAYAALCRMLTMGKRRAPKGSCHLSLSDLLAQHEGLLAIAIPPAGPQLDGPQMGGPQLGGPLLASGRGEPDFAQHLANLREAFGDDRLSLAIRREFGHDDEQRLERLADLASRLRVPLVATNNVHAHAPERRPLQDVLSCIRLGTTLEQAGYALWPNAERHLKPAAEMSRLLSRYPGAIARTLEIAERAQGFDLDQLRYEYPREVVPAGRTPIEHLERLTWEGAAERYPAGVPEKVAGLIRHELGLIGELKYAPYFLTVHDLVRFARSRGILHQGRGAAANSAVCFCLGVTAVDPDRIDMLFERFVSRERDEPPDIDIDFEHERREEVIQYIYAKYGRDRAALTAEVITYRGRSAVRDVGKALGLSLDCVDRLAKSLEWWDDGGIDADRIRELGLDPADRTLRLLAHLCGQILGFPRHLSQHVGGFVITDTPLSELVPIENAAMPDRTVIEWDKDDIDAMGMLKVDCLGLGMLTCIRKAFEMVRAHTGADLCLASIPAEDPAVYDMACRADTVGVFQIESRAQMAMLPRLKPRCFYDLVIEVAIVRPGPIQGKMVHPYLRRRNGEEAFSFPDEGVRRVLGRTLGVPLFQEQAMALAIAAAGFTPGEADQLRRAMAAWKRKGDAIARFGVKLIQGMLDRGYDREFAERCFEQIKGFSEYGFPESHAASFALLVYVSLWLKRHHPAAFAASLINSQPMGFYAPAQIVRDAQQHGVDVRPVDLNHSDWDCTLEDGGRSIRLGMRLVQGLSRPHADALVQERHRHGPYRGPMDALRRTPVPVVALRRLARADAFASLGLDRQRALWEIQSVRDDPLPLFEEVIHGAPRGDAIDHAATLPRIPPARRVHDDYATVGLSLKAHPISFLRPRLEAARAIRAEALADASACPQGRRVRVAGIVLVRQRPSTASGIVFMTIEDETGTANLILRPKVYERFRKAARHNTVVLACGRVERSGIVVHVQVHAVVGLDTWHEGIVATSRDFH